MQHNWEREIHSPNKTLSLQMKSSWASPCSEKVSQRHTNPLISCKDHLLQRKWAAEVYSNAECICVGVSLLKKGPEFRQTPCPPKSPTIFSQTQLVTVLTPQKSPLNHKSMTSRRKKRWLGSSPTAGFSLCVDACVKLQREIMWHVKQVRKCNVRSSTWGYGSKYAENSACSGRVMVMQLNTF